MGKGLRRRRRRYAAQLRGSERLGFNGKVAAFRPVVPQVRHSYGTIGEATACRRASGGWRRGGGADGLQTNNIPGQA